MNELSDAILIGSIVNLIGMMIFFKFRDSAWFKKEAWKMNAQQEKQINKLKLKKLEREMGINKSGKNSVTNEEPQSHPLSGLIPLLNKLDGDQLTSLADKFLPELSANENTGGDGLTGALVNFAKDNPEMIKGFIDKINEIKPNQEQDDLSNFY